MFLCRRPLQVNLKRRRYDLLQLSRNLKLDLTARNQLTRYEELGDSPKVVFQVRRIHESFGSQFNLH
jgi:hypothetical protein